MSLVISGHLIRDLSKGHPASAKAGARLTSPRNTRGTRVAGVE